MEHIGKTVISEMEKIGREMADCPKGFRPMPGNPNVCYFWTFLEDEGDIPGAEELNYDWRCGRDTDFPCPTDGRRPGKE